MITHLIEEEVIEGQRLGRHVEHDPRSRQYAVEPQKVALRTVTHRRYGPLFDQGDLGSCTGNAAAGAINTAPLHLAKHKLLKESDAVSVYELATKLDEFDGSYPPDDTGSSGLAAAKALKQMGLIAQYRHAFNMDEALAALMLGPVITGVNWHEGFDRPDANGYVKLDGQVRGGHEFLVVGLHHYEKFVGDSLVVADNSWGMGWGDRGRFYFRVSTWQKLLDEQGDVTVLVK